MSSTSDQQLSRYFDGELPQGEADAVRTELAAEGDLRAKLEGLTHLSTLMKAGAEERGHEIDGDALFAAIEARLDAEDTDDEVEDSEPLYPEAAPEEHAIERAAERPALRMVAGGAAAGSEAARGAATGSAGRQIEARVVKTAARDTSSRGIAFGMIGGFLAAAAAVLFAIVQDPLADPPETELPLAALPPAGSEVEEVDFGYSTGAIFSVEGQGGEHYAVIWISDEKVGEEEDEEGEERLQ